MTLFRLGIANVCRAIRVYPKARRYDCYKQSETQLIVNINLQALPDKELRQLEQQIATEWRSRLAEVSNSKVTKTDTVHVLRTDPIIDAYKRDVDRTLIRANLKLSAQERLENLMKLQQFAEELRNAGKQTQR